LGEPVKVENLFLGGERRNECVGFFCGMVVLYTSLKLVEKSDWRLVAANLRLEKRKSDH